MAWSQVSTLEFLEDYFQIGLPCMQRIAMQPGAIYTISPTNQTKKCNCHAKYLSMSKLISDVYCQ